MIIDFHVHAFPDKVASRAIEALESNYGEKAFSDGTVVSLLKQMEESRIDISIIQSVSTAARQVVSINNWVSELSYPLIGFGTIHPEFNGYKEEIQRMKEIGIKGVKFQPSFQKFYPDDEKMFPVYHEIIKSGLIMLFHAGDEIKPAPLIYSTPQRIARMLDAMQKDFDAYNYRVKTNGHLKFAAAHVGGYKMWDQVEEHLLGRDIFFDISYFFGHIETQKALKLIRSHGINKILFASDFPFALPGKEIQTLKELDFTREERDKIFSGNAMGFLELAFP